MFWRLLDVAEWKPWEVRTRSEVRIEVEEWLGQEKQARQPLGSDVVHRLFSALRDALGSTAKRFIVFYHLQDELLAEREVKGETSASS